MDSHLFREGGPVRGASVGPAPTPRTYYELSQAPLRIPFPREWRLPAAHNAPANLTPVVRTSGTPSGHSDGSHNTSSPTSSAAQVQPRSFGLWRTVQAHALWAAGLFSTPRGSSTQEETTVGTDDVPPAEPRNSGAIPQSETQPTGSPRQPVPTAPQFIELQARVWRDLTYQNLQRTRRLIKQSERAAMRASRAVAPSAAALASISRGVAVEGTAGSTPVSESGPTRTLTLSPPMTGIVVSATLVPPSAAMVYEIRRVWVIDNDTCEKCCLVPEPSTVGAAAGPGGNPNTGSGNRGDGAGAVRSGTPGTGRPRIVDPVMAWGHSVHADARFPSRRRSGGGSGGGAAGGSVGGSAASVSAAAAAPRHSPSSAVPAAYRSLAVPVALPRSAVPSPENGSRHGSSGGFGAASRLAGAEAGAAWRMLSFPRGLLAARRGAAASGAAAAAVVAVSTRLGIGIEATRDLDAALSPARPPQPPQQLGPSPAPQEPAATVTCYGPPWAVGSSVDVVVQLVHCRTGERVLLRDTDVGVGVELVFRRREVAWLMLTLVLHFLDAVFWAPLRLAARNAGTFAGVAVGVVGGGLGRGSGRA